MSAHEDPSSRPRGATQSYADEQPLAFEAEFDGIRRARAPAEQDPCDPDRYWEFFSSGTD